MSDLTPDNLAAQRQFAEQCLGDPHHHSSWPVRVLALLDHIAKVEAERDALREALGMACEDNYSDPESAARNYIDQARALLDPEDGER